ncbi:MAG: 50S ribosomal protein L6 [Calditrichaeota bacterium]|nr:50S ribosomal protein L6 [Calditrichota bacterium]RQV92379.1 MAG: 50S ribosomal protein L6 [bacterium]RQV98707.1 MAG: 50S ribosomal protein L6 [Calditrichota bacterium]
MSRIGKLPISIPQGVEVKIQDSLARVKGPRGELKTRISQEMEVKQENDQILVNRPSDSIRHRSLHGLTRTLIYNMVEGVTTGFKKNLEIVGVGFKAEKREKGVVLSLGFSHTIYLVPPEGITINTPSPTKIEVSGIDKVLVGEVAAKIRSYRPPEPYKGKGVRYEGESVRRKAGKTAG